MNNIKTELPGALLVACCSVSIATSANEVQDMSDPLAVYTQTGAGVTNKGMNIKVGLAYDTGTVDSMAMNIIEIKGLGADLLGLDGDDSLDSLRFRNFKLVTTNGRGTQIDINWNFDTGSGNASYSFIQALPAMVAVQLYPLAGIGLTVSDSAEIRGQQSDIGSVGYAMPSTYAVIGTYAKITLTEKVWLNYNPMYISTLNDNEYMSDRMDGFHHELVASYQMNPYQNVRLFGNYSATEVNDSWDWRVEFNHQF
ncbi:hypothetical protein [Endozoicomonas arenosclerae]|uniref:hypothetical protein n=1 Tax=Endozoicomonas arenosclerae TaxID=1633495 RepID=UPI000783EB63|nr:hypothetical protein [Endozoicomonas arenosclerae]